MGIMHKMVLTLAALAIAALIPSLYAQLPRGYGYPPPPELINLGVEYLGLGFGVLTLARGGAALISGVIADMEFVQKFTPPDFQDKNFTPSILPNLNSFSKKKIQKMSENGEIYTASKNFTLPPAVTAVTNSTSVCRISRSRGGLKPRQEFQFCDPVFF